MNKKHPYYSHLLKTPLSLPDEEWKNILPKELYHIARQKGTEQPYTGKYWNTSDIGMYYCAACGFALFSSDAKFDSSCGWPSFFEPSQKGSLLYVPDNSFGMKRTEVLCGRCKAHLGHVFEDGPPPTGLRYCINAISLDFESENK